MSAGESNAKGLEVRAAFAEIVAPSASLSRRRPIGILTPKRKGAETQGRLSENLNGGSSTQTKVGAWRFPR